MANESLESALDVLIEQIRESEECRNYREKFEAIRNDDHAMGCVESIRELNVRVQDMGEDEYERESENIAARMEELCADSRVSDFILAEVDFSRLFQYITDSIVKTLDE